jgi:hypothetical protein
MNYVCLSRAIYDQNRKNFEILYLVRLLYENAMPKNITFRCFLGFLKSIRAGVPDPDPGSGIWHRRIGIPDHISQRLKTTFWVKNT